MKRIVALVISLLAATNFGCNEAPAPKEGVPVESASQARRNDDRAIAERLAQQKAGLDEVYARQRGAEERLRLVNVLQAATTRWDEGISEVGRTPRNEIAGPLKKLQVIKAEVEAMELDECTMKARVTLIFGMTGALEALGMFQKETGNISDATNQKLQLGVDSLANAKQEIDSCKPK